MNTLSAKPFHLPWNNADSYWLGIVLPEAEETVAKDLRGLGLKPMDGGRHFMIRTSQHWEEHWRLIRDILSRHGAAERVEAALFSGDHGQPSVDELMLGRAPAAKMSLIADNLWLGNALLEEKVTCHLQPVIDKRGKTFGYESFARMHNEDGTTINGGQIIAAARALNIEHMLDRYLHVQAVKAFIANDSEGVLFVNFMPGFITRPEVYLEGLTEAVVGHGIAPKHVVLDFTNAESPRDMAHMKKVFEYCRSKGYATSLDDIHSTQTATRMIAELHPDFLKLDLNLVRHVHNAVQFATVSQLVEIAHKGGCTVIGEGVETPEVHQALLKAGVDLFQGYLFSPPHMAGKRAKKT